MRRRLLRPRNDPIPGLSRVEALTGWSIRVSPKRVSFRGRLWDAFQTFVGDNTPKRRTIARYIQRPGRILEIGCATGNVADVFRDFDYVGVDTDPELIALACRKFTEPNYRFYCLDVLAAELPEEADFDYVLISHTAHHLPDDYLKRLLHKSCQLLRPGGQLVILDMVSPGAGRAHQQAALLPARPGRALPQRCRVRGTLRRARARGSPGAYRQDPEARNRGHRRRRDPRDEGQAREGDEQRRLPDRGTPSLTTLQ